MADMSVPAADQPEVNAREFALAVAMLVDQWHRKPHEWIEQCACGERWPCKAKDAWLAGAKAMRAALDELDRLRLVDAAQELDS